MADNTGIKNIHRATKTELSEILGITERTIDELRKKGMPSEKPSKRVYFDVPQCVAFYIQYREDLARPDDDGAKDWQTEKVRWQAIKEKNKTLREAGYLVTIDESQQELQYRLTQIRDVVTQIPVTWSHYIIGLETKKDCERKLEDLTDSMLGQLDEAFRQDIPEEEFERDDEEDDD